MPRGPLLRHSTGFTPAGRTPRGFTTIEALIAAVVFLVGLSGLLGALVQARAATGQARRLMQATDVANDLSEQLQMWPFDDKRLVVSDDLCGKDPLDKAHKLRNPGTSDYNAYRACMHGELMLTLGGAKFGGLPDTDFGDEDDRHGLTHYDRFYIVRVENVDGLTQRMQIWVKVLYMDAGEPRVVTTQAMRVYIGGV